MAPATSDTNGDSRMHREEPRSAAEHAEFEIAIEPGRAGGKTVAVAGELDLSTAPRLREVLRLIEEEMGDTAWPVELDFSRVSFIDSTALGIIVAAHKRYEMLAGSPLVISSSSPVVTRVLEISGLDRLLRGDNPSS